MIFGPVRDFRETGVRTRARGEQVGVEDLGQVRGSWGGDRGGNST